MFFGFPSFNTRFPIFNFTIAPHPICGFVVVNKSFWVNR
jgi:hypothetical protein